MPETLALLRAGGREFPRAYVDTPICCPSRTSTLSGRYGHNIGQQSLQNWCGAFTGYALENATWITALHDAGWTASYSGKYHNAPPQHYVPKGYDDFFSLNAECQYMNNTFNDNGKTVAFGDTPADYMTALIGNRSIAFIESALTAGTPFLAYIAPHAPHMPTTPSPWYMDAPLAHGEKAPRTPQYNASGAGKHWLLSDKAPLNAEFASAIDRIYTLRHRALLSVDDIVREVGALLTRYGALDNTYIFYTSDHGYNLGTFRLSVEKFHFLENDIRVPFLVRGPGVAASTISPAIVANIDIGATILDLAGVPPTPTDGRSFAYDLLGRTPPVPPRDRLLIEYGSWGTGYVVRGPCNISCGMCPPALSQLLDAPSNTYSALRIINASHNLAYGEFRANSLTPVGPTGTNWTELYDMNADPWQLHNIANTTPKATLGALSAELWKVASCKELECP